uniref:Uncharacterized protein n=1 Tax=Anopheles minimus TaxID=112268 RepID=A0A182WN48_9DIPT
MAVSSRTGTRQRIIFGQKICIFYYSEL